MAADVEVVIVRHGRTEANASRRIVGVLDVPLDEVGAEQARALAAGWKWGRPDVVVSSPLLRARQTAAALDPEPRIVAELREMNQGALEGLALDVAWREHREVFAAMAQDPEGTVLPGGESLGQVRDRALAALDGIAEAYAGRRVAVFTHQMVIVALGVQVSGQPWARWREWVLGNTEGRVLKGRPGAWFWGP